MALQTLTINLGKLVSKWTGFFAICECAALLKIPFLFLKRKTSLIKKRCLSKWEVYLVNCELSSWSFFLTKFLSNYPLKDVLSHSKFNGNCMPLKTIVSPISILLNALLQCLMLESLQQIYATMGIHLYQLHHHWVTSWRTPQNLRPS